MTGFEPCFALFAALAFGAVFFVVRQGVRRQGFRDGPPLIGALLAPTQVSAAAASTEAFSKRDAEFSPQRVEGHTRQLVDTITRAVEAGATDPVHPWLSDGLFERVAKGLGAQSAFDRAFTRHVRELMTSPRP